VVRRSSQDACKPLAPAFGAAFSEVWMDGYRETDHRIAPRLIAEGSARIRKLPTQVAERDVGLVALPSDPKAGVHQRVGGAGLVVGAPTGIFLKLLGRIASRCVEVKWAGPAERQLLFRAAAALPRFGAARKSGAVKRGGGGGRRERFSHRRIQGRQAHEHSGKKQQPPHAANLQTRRFGGASEKEVYSASGSSAARAAYIPAVSGAARCQDERREPMATAAGDIVFVGLSEHWGSVIALSDFELRCWNLVGGPAFGSEKVAVLMKVLDQQHCDFALRMLKLGKHSARERLWALMLWMAKRGNDASGQFHQPPRSDIADFLGLAPETVSRLWESYLEEGLLTRVGSQRWRFCPPQAGGNDSGGGGGDGESAFAF